MTGKQQKIICGISALLKKQYSGDFSGHDWLHLQRVLTTARRLSEGEKADMFLVETGSLLHDVDDFKFHKPGDDPTGKTKEILEKYEIEEKIKKRILDIISHVSYKADDRLSVQKTLEGKIVQDADRLDAMGAIGISRTFAYNGHTGNAIYDPVHPPNPKISAEEYMKNRSTAINHFYEKLLLLKNKLNTPQARKIAEHRHKFLEDFLREFWAEVKGEL
jgi:uncharacterized protein